MGKFKLYLNINLKNSIYTNYYMNYISSCAFLQRLKKQSDTLEKKNTRIRKFIKYDRSKRQN